MKWITTYCLTCILLFGGLSSNQALATNPQIDSLIKAGQWKLAALEYERMAFNATNNEQRVTALVLKSTLQIANDEFDGALSSISRVQFYDLPDSLAAAAREQWAFVCYLKKDFESAEAQFIQLHMSLPESLGVRSNLLYALTLNEIRKWDRADSVIQVWIKYAYDTQPIIRDSLSQICLDLYQPKNQPKWKNPKTAEMLSMLLPGSGQLYSGQLYDAAFSALMVLTGLGIAAYGVLVVKYYITGFVYGYSFFQRFYVAGLRRSSYLAERTNYRRQRKYNDLLSDYIQEVSSFYVK